MVKRIVFCGRCWREHESVEFRPFTKSFRMLGQDFTHWASCPASGEPMLLSAEPEDDLSAVVHHG